MSDSEPKRQSLLKKYDIPVSYLDFSYIRPCSKPKVIEKIIKVLRSQEEGYFPDLLKFAEEKLQELDPSNKLLRTEGKLLYKDNLEPQYWKSILDDIEKWSDESTKKEKELINSKNKSSEGGEDTLPPIRRPPKTMDNRDQKDTDKGKERISSWDYKKWDQYDVDAEIVKMDLEEERRKQEPQVNKKYDTESQLEQIGKEASEAAVSMSKSEKEILAMKEKDLGNEFYKNKDYKLAVRSYTKSIAVYPTSVAYNNRAMSYLSLECYDKAISDATVVIQMDPSNVKALYRRAQAYEKQSEFTKALSDLNTILKLEPNNAPAKVMKEKLKNKKSSAKPKSSAASHAKRSKLSLERGVTPGSSSSLSSGDRAIAGPSGVKPIISEIPVTTKKIHSNIKATPEKKERDRSNERRPKRESMRKINVLEMDQDDDDSVFDWRRYFTEGRSAKVEVASKFREKASKEPRPESKLIEEIQYKPLPSSPRTETIESPRTKGNEPSRHIEFDASNFTHTWSLLSREKAPLSVKAQLLRSVRPHLLQAVIGNKLEEGMLRDFLLCLRDEFKTKTETPLIIEYLTSFARLDRFSIINTFLPSDTKQVIQDLLNKIEADESLRKLYY